MVPDVPEDRDTGPAARAAVVRDAVGIGVATGTYALSFGAIAQAAGFSVAQACVFSLAMFTGASQFALVGVVGPAAGRRRGSPRPSSWARGMRSTASGSHAAAPAAFLALMAPRLRDRETAVMAAAAAAIAVLARAPFLVVIVAACGATALVRAVS
jgi:predicted branched-subunit amino acid permease